MFFSPFSCCHNCVTRGFLIQFSTSFIHVSQNANSCNIMRLFMISKYHLLMYLPGQQSSSPVNLTEPELPVTIPKCPAIHFHFLVSLASHCTFFKFPSRAFFFFPTAIMERKMLLAAGVQSPKRHCSRSLSSKIILVVYRGKNISSVLDVSPDASMVSPEPPAPERESAA